MSRVISRCLAIYRVVLRYLIISNLISLLQTGDCLTLAYHIKFDFAVADELSKRISALDRGGLGISIEIVINCLMAVREQWQQYYRLIELNTPRADALHLFDSTETCVISLPLLRKAMELMR